MNKWDKPEYQRISEARYRNGKLIVRFEGGSEAAVNAVAVLPPGQHRVAWDEIHVDPYEIVITLDDRRFEIPWSSIRVLTDHEYSAHLERIADERSTAIGVRLRKLRESRGMTSREVAERAGISAQSLSRIENGRHDVVFSTLEKILRAIGASLRDLAETENHHSPHEDSSVNDQHGLISLNQIARKLSKYGFSSKFIQQRIAGQAAGGLSVQTDSAVKRLARLFHCSAANIATGDIHLRLDTLGAFKMPEATASLKSAAYAIYAHELCSWTLDAFDRPWQPMSAKQTIEAIRIATSVPTYEALLSFMWSIGVPVLPLSDSGGFHGACWMINRRPVIVVKQKTNFHARWLFDLSHELGHILLHLVNGEGSFVDVNEIIPFGAGTPAEDQANDFAHHLLLDGRQEELIAEIVKRAGGKIPLLKRATIEVAAKRNVPVDLLANYLAYRLSLQKESWWPTAASLQYTEPSPLQISREMYLAHVDLELLDSDQRALLDNALRD